MMKGGPTLHQKMEICKSQAHIQMLTAKIENVYWNNKDDIYFCRYLKQYLMMENRTDIKK